MKISLRILLGYFLIVGLAAYFVLTVFIEEVKPGVREAMEDTLVDTANLLAELAAPELAAGRIGEGAFARAVRSYGERPVEATIWSFRKDSLDYRIYVTDARGRVVFATDTGEIGKDYSRWRDVARTLQGRYGARSSRDDPQDESSSVMHVAAPIREGDRVIGVLTVAKPNATVQPFIERSERKIRNRGFILLAAAAAIGAFFTWRLTRSINRLRRYARDVSEGRKAPPPESGASEIAELGRALAAMREKLEGKQYVEQYVQTLTHELKSPLAAIRGAAELLDEDMPREQRRRFLANIREQTERLRQVGERMLSLATVEQRQALERVERVELRPLLESVLESLTPRLASRMLTCSVAADTGLSVKGERFLLSQALTNLLDNAIDFSPDGAHIELAAAADGTRVRVTIRDHGPGIPDYALPRVFERFYSLPRPDTGRKSTGLGLAFVREVAALHGGDIRLANHAGGGATASLDLPGWDA